MGWSAENASATSSLVGELAAYFADRHGEAKAAMLTDLAQLALRRSDLGEGEPELAVLAGHIEALLDFVDARGAQPWSVRVRPGLDSLSAAETSILEVNIDDAPFLVESITGEVKARDVALRHSLYPVIGTERGDSGRLLAIAHARHAPARESVQHYELGRILTPEEAESLTVAVERVLVDVTRAVGDFAAMREAVGRMIDLARVGAYHYTQQEVDEAVEFLEWLLDDNFVFLGYREYEMLDTPEGRAIQVVPASGLGVLNDATTSNMAEPVLIDALAPDRRERYMSGNLLVITKTNRSATVHRRARMDYLGVRLIGSDGRVMGEARLVGLFTAKAYMVPSSSMPLLRRKLEWIVEREDLIEGSHDHRAVVQIFDSFPKEELFSVPQDELADTIADLLHLEERRDVHLFVRSDLLRRSVSVMVALPRDRFNARLRKQLQELIQERYAGTAIDYRLALGHADSARIHFTVWTGDVIPEVSFSELEAEVVELARTWEDDVGSRLVARLGEERGRALVELWAPRFPDYYKTSTPLEIAVGDVEALAQLEADQAPLRIGLQNEPEGTEGLTRISFYHRGEKLPLSDMMPILEDLGLQIIEEVPTRLRCGDGEILIHDFGVLGPDGEALDLDRCAERLANLVSAVWEGKAESDSLNRLIVTAGLRHDEINVLRAYRKYWRRVEPQFTVDYVNDTLSTHPEISAQLVRFFRARFRPSGKDSDAAAVYGDLLVAVDLVESLDEDRILRGFVELIQATVRTNAYRMGRRSLAFKLRSADVPGMPEPRPLFEIFVYAPEVEGIHLRGGRVARGGLRWSDRREDYRTEVLDLMKAQMTKNVVIVPTGAKGGFVLRRPPAEDPRDAVREAYEIFVSGLLDVTDNLEAGSVVPPVAVRVHDEPDPYLVVAADRGTAALSDVANALAAKYRFWLGDAFASGGSAGYDHKALGITARGAWESVSHHFHELGVDVDREPITAVGIGDMSGDVFGNGMLLSPGLRLVAAFDHRHVFIDPDPDPAIAHAERRRLFALPRSSWDDYDRSAISAGGGVFPRTAKRIELSAEARRALGTERATVTPNELIRDVLRAPVDLLWNGGIGTYVKARGEADADVGDRTNDAVRVLGRELRCRVVAEGGNLGFTQSGRVEYATRGGRINTDFIDNSGGVHCSDREVNLKILLDLAIDRGMLDAADRSPLIEELAEDITRRVTYGNFLQAQILSQEVVASRHRLDAYEDLMAALEEEGLLDRTMEHLPATDQVLERTRAHAGMAAPELAVLLAYAKRWLTDQLLESDLPDAEAFQDDLVAYFPDEVVDRFGSLIPEHPLRRELIATIVANEVINSEGITFVARLATETGSPAASIVRAYRVARIVTDAGRLWDDVEDLEGKIAPALQHELLNGVDGLVEATTRWYLARGEIDVGPATLRATQEAFAELEGELRRVGPPSWVAAHDAQVVDLAAAGVPEVVARRHAYRDAMVHAPDIVELARERRLPLDFVSRLSFRVARVFHLDVLADRLAAIPRSDPWQRAAAQTVAADLLRVRRHLTERVAADADGAGEADAAVDAYVASRREQYDRLMRFMRSLALESGDDVAALVVAVRRIESLVG